jgi:23S rRNA pseudouridine1911/1915/1917 synthase
MPRRREVVPAVLAGERVDRAVALLTGRARSDVAELIAAGAVLVGGRAATARSRRLREGEVIELDLAETGDGGELEPDPTVDVPVVAADDQVIVVDKPAGLVVHPGAGRPRGTLVQGLLARYPDLRAAGQAVGADPHRPGIVHRLDKGTSGLLVVARTAAAYRSLTGQLAARRMERRYQALVWGALEGDRGLIDAPLSRAPRDRTRIAVVASGREARTGFQVVARFSRPSSLTLVECRLETGRTHQIRAHMAALGHPVVGDTRYRGRTVPGLGRPFLHAGYLSFSHPTTGAVCAYSSPLPADLDAVLGGLSTDESEARPFP